MEDLTAHRNGSQVSGETPWPREARIEEQPPDVLTGREKEVLILLSEGKSNKEIARMLLISPSTAKAHVSRILHKLGKVSRTEAAVYWERVKTALPRRDG